MKFIPFAYMTDNNVNPYPFDGKYVLTATTPPNKTLQLSTDFGSTFTNVTGSTNNENWTDFSINGDGTLFVACSTNTSTGTTDGSIFKSTNGTTWNKVTSAGSRMWNGIDVTTDGSIWCAAVSGSSIYYSTDSGTTFTEITGSTKNWNRIVLNKSNGTSIYALVNNLSDYIYKYSGGTMVPITSAGQKNWDAISVSANGQYVMCVEGYTTTNGNIYLSTDYGVTFNLVTNIPPQPLGFNTPVSCDMSSDGQYMIVTSREFKEIIVSQNYGNSFFDASGGLLQYTTNFSAVSQSGKYMIVDGDSTYLALSNNFGSNFSLNIGAGQPTRIQIVYNK